MIVVRWTIGAVSLALAFASLGLAVYLGGI